MLLRFSTETEELIRNNDPAWSDLVFAGENNMLLRLAAALAVNTVVTRLVLDFHSHSTSFPALSRDDLGVLFEVFRTRPFDRIRLRGSPELDDRLVAFFLRAIQQNPSQPLCYLSHCVIQPETIRFFPPKVSLHAVRLPAGVHDFQIVDMVAANRNLFRLELSDQYSLSFMIPCIQGTMNHPTLLDLRVNLDVFEQERVVDLVGVLSATIRAPKCALKHLKLDTWNWKLKENYPIALAVHDNKTIESIEFRRCHLHSKVSVMFDSLPLRRHLSLIECECYDPDVVTRVLGRSRGLNSVTCEFCPFFPSIRASMLEGLFQGLKHRASSVRKLSLQDISLNDIALVADTIGSIQIEELSLTFCDLGRRGNRESREAAIKSGFCRNASIVRCDLATAENPFNDNWAAPFHTGLVATVDWSCRRNRRNHELPLAVKKFSQPSGCHAILPLLLHASHTTLIAESLLRSEDGVGDA